MPDVSYELRAAFDGAEECEIVKGQIWLEQFPEFRTAEQFEQFIPADTALQDM